MLVSPQYRHECTSNTPTARTKDRCETDLVCACTGFLLQSLLSSTSIFCSCCLPCLDGAAAPAFGVAGLWLAAVEVEALAEGATGLSSEMSGLGCTLFMNLRPKVPFESERPDMMCETREGEPKSKKAESWRCECGEV